MNKAASATQHKIDQLRNNRSDGASELARRALSIVSYAAQHLPATNQQDLLRQLSDLIEEIITTRPSMAPIGELLTQLKTAIRRIEPNGLEFMRLEVERCSGQLVTDSRQALDALVEQALQVIGSNKTIITHSYSSTLLRIFKRVTDRNIRIILSESRPLNEGQRLAAQLADLSIETTLITDAQMGILIKQADMALVGADSLLSDGSVVNKAGTYLLALAAQDNSVPFVVCSESFKKRRPGLGSVKIEQMDRAELDADVSAVVQIKNYYFDITPAKYVSAWITEAGVSYNEGQDR